MISLGELSIRDGNSMVRARDKIRALAQDMRFDSISVTRLATMTSELSRGMVKGGDASSLKVWLDEREGVFRLVLGFTSDPTEARVRIETLEAVFDRVETSQGGDGFESIQTYKFLPDPEFEPTEEFIAREREMLGRLTAEELYAQLGEAHRRLQESSQLLIQTEKATVIGTVVGGVAHELNNPIMGILHFSQYCLKHTSEDDPRYPVLRDIEQETKRCASIVQNLLAVSHIERESEHAYRRGSVPAVFDQVLHLLSYRIEEHGVLVSRHTADGIPDIWVNVNNIQQVFMNLISNALHAVKESEKKEIHIDTRCLGEFVQVTIADTGCGIAPENIGKIFEPFFTTMPLGHGTGLGLSISRSIIEAHGGRISCESELGTGTKVKVLLPVNRSEGEGR